MLHPAVIGQVRGAVPRGYRQACQRAGDARGRLIPLTLIPLWDPAAAAAAEASQVAVADPARASTTVEPQTLPVEAAMETATREAETDGARAADDGAGPGAAAVGDAGDAEAASNPPDPDPLDLQFVLTEDETLLEQEEKRNVVGLGTVVPVPLQLPPPEMR